jgi:ferritin
MLSQSLQNALNDQINKEFFSEYQYLAMSSYFDSIDLNGFANYFNIQAQEEHFHAMKMFNFVHNMGGRVSLKALGAPKNEFSSIIEAFEDTLNHERYISKSINDLINIGIGENNHAVVSFLKWYVDEQVEEESSVSNILGRLKLINGEGHGLLMLDNEFAQRRFTPETEA